MLVIYEYSFGLVQWSLNMNEWDSFFCFSNTSFGFGIIMISLLFCNEKSQTWFHNPWISLCILLILFLLETLSLQLSKDDNFVRVMTMIPHIVFRDSVGGFGTIYHLFWLGKCIKPISNFSLVHKSWVDYWDSALYSILCHSWPKMIMSYGSEL